ncbi:MAG: CRISPR-associated endonuclease Cas1 [Anaerolineae bacterium]|nr:CRISPR-associated endonuclease Cas1 [Anaerolineae bacterium]
MPIIQNLIADTFGSHIGKYQGRLKVTQGGTTLAQAPIMHLERVLVTSKGVSVSAETIRACTERGIPIHFLSGRGTPYASLYSAGLTGTVLTRRAQLSAYQTGVGIELAFAFVVGKIENQGNFLKYVAKYRKGKQPEVYRELRWLAGEVLDHCEEIETLHFLSKQEAYAIDEMRGQLLSIEGRAAQKYWNGFKQVLPEALAWPGRQRRGAKDPFNSALNYGYGILYGEIEKAIVLAGLDPYAGFIHVDRPGKPSLVLDVIEEFRTPVVDRTVLGLVNKGVKLEQDERGMLTEKTRHTLAEKILGRLESPEKYESKRHPLRSIIQQQARHIATYVRGERDLYLPFTTSW